ncbi:mitochondrial folate transporter-like protein/carrier [Eremomyces bilateralis CBS 781.70]|uniref:Mitochondrial folate transporter-like protein/carrier n=1 Tax=Eremomyces bilateralis CBS 781.70 TaxID=1392243 RepID=A0A6G1FX24_9PEZI|nr:mitochondrial folate transporter-like protein/carrier [Eremomyces bilateralis CBS 781.70]KAF1810216.1 mitochondrial folate transporter-like protein/carrier [Eremomyces bilateralis CBS 781.70]
MSRGPSSAPPVQTTRSEPNARLALYCTKLPSTTVNSFCGAMAGMASGIVTCPLDVIKTKLQAQGVYSVHSVKRAPSHMLYNGMMGTARVIWREERFRGLYRGLGPMLLGYLPTWAVYMSVYEKSREYYYTQIENKWVGRVYASITAGACSTLATNPIWVIKTRLMSQMHPRTPAEANVPWYYRSTLDAARKMWRNEGFRAFYSGLTPALLGLSHVAIQFPLYEFFKMQFTGLEMGEASPNDHDMHWLGILGATFLSKVCATSATYPHEVLRTRLQTQQRIAPSPSHEGISFRGGLGQGVHSRAPGTASSDGMINMPRYRGVIRTARAILHEEGWRSFYNGMGTNMIRAVPAAMTTMLTFETLKAAITRLQKEGNEMLDMDHR